MLAALFWLRGASIKEAATAATIGERTLARYLLSDWWPRAIEDARSRWYGGIEMGARRLLGKAMDDDGGG